jgi:hypothetical protein
MTVDPEAKVAQRRAEAEAAEVEAEQMFTAYEVKRAATKDAGAGRPREQSWRPPKIG